MKNEYRGMIDGALKKKGMTIDDLLDAWGVGHHRNCVPIRTRYLAMVYDTGVNGYQKIRPDRIEVYASLLGLDFLELYTAMANKRLRQMQHVLSRKLSEHLEAKKQEAYPNDREGI